MHLCVGEICLLMSVIYSHQATVPRGTTQFLMIWTASARGGHSLTLMHTGASSSVQIFAMIAVDALALNMPMALKSMVHVAPTQVVTAT